MKILQVNKFFYPKGGADKYFLELSEQLRRNGHEVRFFAMSDQHNLPTEDGRYFVSNISFDDDSLRTRWQAASRIVYSPEAKEKFAALLKDFQPDIIHLHNIYHQLSPSIIDAGRAAGIPIVMHLHDYKLICPNFKLFTGGEVCYRCQTHKYYNSLTHRCLDNSLLKSAGAALEMTLHHQVLKIYEKGVDLFIAPSRFMKQTVEDFGWPAEKLHYLPNFFSPEFIAGAAAPKLNRTAKAQDYLLYFGRLAEEKGIEVLLRALPLTKARLKIAGTGSEEERLRSLVARLELGDRVELLGQRTGADLVGLVKEAKAVIIPSVWLENMPLNLLEALALGQIVIASDIGGLPELIQDGYNGLLFQPGDHQDLAEKINRLKDLDRDKVGQAARETVETLNLKDHTHRIENIYQEILTNHRRKVS